MVLFLIIVVPLAVTAVSPSPTSCVSDPTPLERGILAENNRARRDPPAYAAELERLLPLYDEDRRRRLGKNFFLVTEEGTQAVQEAIRDLRRTPPRPALRWDACLAQSAQEHVRDKGPKGQMGHNSSRGERFGARIRRHQPAFRRAGENIHYGLSESAADVVQALIIDDGVPHRGHRDNILHPDFNAAGVACGPHRRRDQMCVTDYAAE